jgi:AcrR family transcriptional regulator
MTGGHFLGPTAPFSRPRMTTRQQQKSQATQQRLMDAAVELFGKNGYLETTVEEITRHAGYAKGSFYRHFATKDHLFLAVVERKLAEYRAARDERIGRARSLTEALTIIWDFLETMVADRENGAWAKVFLEFTVHAARDPELRSAMRQEQYRLSETIFVRLVEPLVPEDYPAAKLAALNTALFEGFMVHNALETGVLDLADVREAAVALAEHFHKPI